MAAPAVALGATAASDGERAAYIGDRSDNHVVVSSVGNDVRFEAIGEPIVLSGECVADGPSVAICDTGGDDFKGAEHEVRTRGGDDRIVGGTKAPDEGSFWHAGRGDDLVRITHGTVFADGGPGDDRMILDARRHASIDGDRGNDTLIFRGACGRFSGGGRGGPGDDRFIAVQDGRRTGCGGAFGNGGEDTYELRSKDGRGMCFATRACRHTGFVDRIVGTEHDDELRGVSSVLVPCCPIPPLTPRMKHGAVVVGNGGRDILRGAYGQVADRINARDGERDRLIDCGRGAGDVALIDRMDPEPKRCERVIRR